MRPVLAVLACLAAAAAGCGGDDGDGAQRIPPAVDLTVTEPNDLATVQSETVEVRGTVAPAGATVRVLGKEASVSGGTFSAEIALQPGPNVVDVMATARGRGPALTAFRVTREMPVAVPDLEGVDVREAQSRVADAGLEIEVTEGGGLFDDLFPGEPAVCSQEPEAGKEVRRGTTVRVEVAKRC